MLSSEMIDVFYRLIFICMLFVVLVTGVLYVAIKIKKCLLWRAYLKVHGKGGLNDSNSDKP